MREYFLFLVIFYEIFGLFCWFCDRFCVSINWIWLRSAKLAQQTLRCDRTGNRTDAINYEIMRYCLVRLCHRYDFDRVALIGLDLSLIVWAMLLLAWQDTFRVEMHKTGRKPANRKPFLIKPSSTHTHR